MTPSNRGPEWACNDWGKPEHDWHHCPDCLAAYEIMIEQAQDDAQLDAVDTRVGFAN
jgi:hypothetical protein